MSKALRNQGKHHYLEKEQKENDGNERNEKCQEHEIIEEKIAKEAAKFAHIVVGTKETDPSKFPQQKP